VPAVSILVPAFNAEATLPAALESLRRQTLLDWECLLCDDGSTDATLAVAEAYARADSRFIVVHQPHAGLVLTLNHGLQKCRAAYIARFDADDIAHRERLAAQFRFMTEHPEIAGVGCGVRMFPRAILTEGRRNYETWLNRLANDSDISRDRFIECPLAHPTWFMKRDTLLDFGYRERPWPEDYDLILRVLGAGHRLSTLPRRLMLWRESASRLSRSDRRYTIERFTECRAQFLATDWLSGAERYGLWGYGSTGRSLARALASHGKHPAYIVELHPGRIGQKIMGVPVVHPSDVPALRQPGSKLIISVAGLLQRLQARKLALSIVLCDGVDFVCAA
jgi:glycosyltransferase involved in cell wall biosynthesis